MQQNRTNRKLNYWLGAKGTWDSELEDTRNIDHSQRGSYRDADHLWILVRFRASNGCFYFSFLCHFVISVISLLRKISNIDTVWLLRPSRLRIQVPWEVCLPWSPCVNRKSKHRGKTRNGGSSRAEEDGVISPPGKMVHLPSCTAGTHPHWGLWDMRGYAGQTKTSL